MIMEVNLLVFLSYTCKCWMELKLGLLQSRIHKQMLSMNARLHQSISNSLCTSYVKGSSSNQGISSSEYCGYQFAASYAARALFIVHCVNLIPEISFFKFISYYMYECTDVQMAVENLNTHCGKRLFLFTYVY